ncbi:MAG: hypothetical protein ABIP79_09650 [Chitinophagaceae bacterium]
MRLDKNGNLRETKILSYEEFKKVFGFNESRKEKLKRVLLFLKILKSFGCTNVYVAGSFVSSKEFPNDIDLCVDITNIDYRKLAKEYPELLQVKGIEKIRNEHNVHFALFFDFGSTELLDFFKKDREDNPKGLVKIYLSDIDDYD